MSDLSALRAEIKHWERTFKAKNGRDPSFQDIRDQPAMAEKYKLYKKLSKAAAAAAAFADLSQATPSDVPPSTPPRTHPPTRPSVIRSTKRIIEPAGPLSSFNPFSPVKNKGKQKNIFQFTDAKSGVHSNPFTTPVKANVSGKEDAAPSTDLFPVLQPLSSRVIEPKAPVDALSRARKRLRGEPVSPSPSKEKRPRINSHTPLPLPTLAPQSANSDDDKDSEEEGGADSSFVNDSPVKRPAGHKSFKLLFEETVPQKLLPKTRGRSTRSKPTPGSAGLFGNSSHKASNDVFSRAVDLDERDQGPPAVWNKHANTSSKHSKQYEEVPSSQGNTPDVSSLQNQLPRIPGKRSLSESESSPTIIAQGNFRVPLLPPSPPPPVPSSSRYKAKMNDKGTSRKKSKTIKEIEGDGDGEDTHSYTVKLVDRSHGKAHRPNENDIDTESDPLLFAIHRPHDRNDQVVESWNHTVDLQVNLPERLIHMLAISPPKARDHKEEQLVRGLLHGGRTTRYDPRRGGEIWDVGEGGDDRTGDTESEGDWEGEPVPWEVGEL